MHREIIQSVQLVRDLLMKGFSRWPTSLQLYLVGRVMELIDFETGFSFRRQAKYKSS